MTVEHHCDRETVVKKVVVNLLRFRTPPHMCKFKKERCRHPRLLRDLVRCSGFGTLAELSRFGIRREWFDGIPHPALFERFSRALGVMRTEGIESDQLVCWRELLLNVLSHGGPAEALGP